MGRKVIVKDFKTPRRTLSFSLFLCAILIYTIIQSSDGCLAIFGRSGIVEKCEGEYWIGVAFYVFWGIISIFGTLHGLRSLIKSK